MNTLEPLGFYTPLLIRKGVMRLPFLWLRCLAQSRQTLPQQLMGDWKQVGRVGRQCRGFSITQTWVSTAVLALTCDSG